MEKIVKDIIGNHLDELGVWIDSVKLNEDVKPKHLEVCLDSEKTLDLDLITEASKIINELIDNSNFDLDDYVLEIYGKSKGENNNEKN